MAMAAQKMEPVLPGTPSVSDERDIGEFEQPGQSNALGSKGRRASATQHLEDLQSLKIETMRGMAKTVKYSRGESICTCKVAYFTTKQLLNISAEKMPKLRQALEIQEPKLVIRLFPCLRGRSYWNRFPKRNPSNPTYSPPELSDADEDRVEQELNLIAKEVLLPLAVRSHALVVGVSACALMNAFANVCGPIQRRYGDKCPFRMICLEHACHLHMAVKSYDGVERAIWNETPEWRRSDANIRKALEAMFGADPGQWPRQQLLPGCEQYVIYQSLGDPDDCTIDFRAGNRFSDMFVSSLSTFLPAIGIWTYGDRDLHLVGQVAEHVSDGMPLLLLNSRASTFKLRSEDGSLVRETVRELPPFLCNSQGKLQEYWNHCHDLCNSLRNETLAEYSQNLLQIAAALMGQSKADAYTASALACLKMAVVKQREGQGSREDSKMWLCNAVEAAVVDRTYSAAIDAMGLDDDGVALQEEELSQVVQFFLNYVGVQDSLIAQIATKGCHDALDQLKQAESFEDLEAIWDKQIPTLMVTLEHSLHSPSISWKLQGSQGRQELELLDIQKDDASMRICINRKLQGAVEFEDVHSKLIDNIKFCLERNAKYDQSRHNVKSFASNKEKWHTVYMILKSSNVFSCGSHEYSTLRAELEELASADHLPQNNTLQALILLRYAWTLSDLFDAQSRQSKLMSKLTYFMLLFLSTAVVVVTATPGMAEVTGEVRKYLVLALGLASGSLAAWTSFANPVKRWHKLRACSQMLQTEIWKFRTRIGDYDLTDIDRVSRIEAVQRAETRFRERIEDIQQTLLDTGIVVVNVFSAATISDEVCVKLQGSPEEVKNRMIARSKLQGFKSHCKHHQYRGAENKNLQGPKDGEDSFHAPVRPDEYITWRVSPLLAFYQKRFPVYGWIRLLLHAAFIICSITTSVLAAANLESWTALVVSISAALGSWQEFIRVGEKLDRYATIIQRLTLLMLWWQSLPDVDKANSRNIQMLVESGEGAVAEENSAWLSDARATKKMLHATHGSKLRPRTELQRVEVKS